MAASVTRATFAILAVLALFAPRAACAQHAHAPAQLADSLMTVMQGHTLDPIEGIWQWPDDGAIIAVVRTGATTFAIILLDSPNTAIPPSTEIGSAHVTTRPGTYDATLMSLLDKHGLLSRPKTFAITVSDRGTMALAEYTTGYGLDLRRILPYLFRHIVKPGTKKPAGLDGPVKIYPKVGPEAVPVIL